MSRKNRDTARKVKEMQAKQRAAEQRRRNLIVGAVVAVVIVLVVVIAIAVNNKKDSVAGATPPAGVSDTYGILVGDSAAPVTVTLYEDFQCPICKQYEGWLGDTITKDIDDGTIQVEYRPMAFLDRMSSTDYSSRALETAACTLDENGVDAYVKLHGLLFANQPAENTAGLTDSALADLAAQAGADKSAIETCQSDDTFTDWVKAATDAASKDHVSGTPTMRIDGKDVPITTASSQDAAIQVFNDAVTAAQQ